MQLTAAYLIEALNLKPLEPEGGYYMQTAKSAEVLSKHQLPERYKSDRSLYSAIYYLHTPETKSLLHILPTDEIYHFYLGDPVILVLLFPDSRVELVTLGPDISQGQELQVVVPRGVWQGSMLREGGTVALLGTTMAPGYEDEDFVLGERETLVSRYPAYRDVITKLTPESA